jgi:hypothetical protein
MGRRLRVVRAWMSPLNDARAHLVFLLNGGVSLIVGAGPWNLPMAWRLTIGAAVFVVLTACLLSRRTAIVAGLLGSSFAAVIGGAMAWTFSSGREAARLFAGLSGSSAFVLAFLIYRRFVRATTGGGDLEGRFTGAFNERDEQRRKGSGVATVVVSPTDEGDHDLRVTGLVVGGVAVDFFGARREGETIADLRTGAAPAARFELLRGKISIHGSSLIVDLEGSPFGSYVFTGHRARD